MMAHPRQDCPNKDPMPCYNTNTTAPRSDAGPRVCHHCLLISDTSAATWSGKQGCAVLVVSAGTMPLGLGMFPFQGSYPPTVAVLATSCIPSLLPGVEFSYNLLQLQCIFTRALTATVPLTSLDPRKCHSYFPPLLYLCLLSLSWLLFCRLSICSGPSQPN